VSVSVCRGGRRAAAAAAAAAAADAAGRGGCVYDTDDTHHRKQPEGEVGKEHGDGDEQYAPDQGVWDRHAPRQRAGRAAGRRAGRTRRRRSGMGVEW
jgi:hypothetical protein